MDEIKNQIILRPQEGYQEQALACAADILISGGSAGAGKTFSLLMEPVRHKDVKDFYGVIFRRTTIQIRNEGGLWQTSSSIYPLCGARPNETNLLWKFPSGMRMKFSHLEYEKNIYDHQGGQYAFIGFDELTHFTQSMFFYMLSRNRSGCGVRPYIRATCNPDPDSWVAKFIKWFIDQETGLPIPERNGKLRYFIVDGKVPIWGNSKQEVLKKASYLVKEYAKRGVKPEDLVKSMTFIRGSVYDNQELIKANPEYLGNLMSLDPETRSRLLDGNWKIKQDDLALADYVKVEEIFTNKKVKTDEEPKHYITIDAARKGRNLAVIMTWEDWRVVRTDIFTTCTTSEQVAEAEKRRSEYVGIGKSDVLVDQDGVGGGVVDEGGFTGFSGGATAMEDPDTGIKENYANLKTQCAYRLANRINRNQVVVDDNFYVDGVKTDSVMIGSEPIDIKTLIKQDIRSLKKEKADYDGKLKILSKEKQKVLLSGRSPDCGDAMLMREFFELQEDVNCYYAEC